eukprot:1990377-Heterocapsa_arctica.AAC.1
MNVTCVKKAIDDMIVEHLKQKEDEIKDKDFCVDEFNTTQLQTEQKALKKEIAALCDYDMLKQFLRDEIEFALKGLSEAKKGLAASAEKKFTVEGELTVMTKDLDSDVTSEVPAPRS